ncbi:hypothetical protein F4820DRAFT_418854 [Hypoxylon rubiginosum]|uniref:Uncharacterized protein n=1 Tax=Hypoxylon rubiginosum TaxID=110542 RepID=A0ACB9Z303_9PEZI|nr:hypothetical protein F4820DRAFT_418854 [Hypoxylon rubiginosum]
MNNASSAGYGFDSPTSTESGTPIPTPSTSRASTISQSSSTNIPPGPLNLTPLSTTSWRQPYPSIGQFAATDSEEVVAAGPNGLFYFRRVRDLAATPWSEPRPIPSAQVALNELTVSGLALYSGYDSQDRSRLYLYCVSGGVLYSFYLTDKDNSSFLPDTSHPLAGRKVTGKPTVVKSSSNTLGSSDRWSLVVPCQSGGLLHTSTTALRSIEPDLPFSMNSKSCNNSASTEWEDADHLVTDLGIISAVSVTAVHNSIGDTTDSKTELVAVCISRGQLNVVQGPFREDDSSGWKWEGKTSTRILHPGEVTGNPVLITDRNHDKNQLDLLVPSAERGIFHFVRTQSAPNDWHMIGRVAFPQNIPPASCLSFHCRRITSKTRVLHALIQICGRLYHLQTVSNELPWYNARLEPIVQPGPFFE